jgi:hypothetical protein
MVFSPLQNSNKMVKIDLFDFNGKIAFDDYAGRQT